MKFFSQKFIFKRSNMDDFPFLLSHEEIIFRDMQAGSTDSTTIYLTNTSIKPQTVHYSISGNPIFSLQSKLLPMIVPGYRTECSVICKPNDVFPEEAFLLIECKTGSRKIPIKSYPPMPEITPSTTIIDIGNIPLNSSHTSFFSIANYGAIRGSYQIESKNKDIIFSPSNGFLQPSETQKISFTFKSSTTGKYQFDIDI